MLKKWWFWSIVIFVLWEGFFSLNVLIPSDFYQFFYVAFALPFFLSSLPLVISNWRSEGIDRNSTRGKRLVRLGKFIALPIIIISLASWFWKIHPEQDSIIFNVLFLGGTVYIVILSALRSSPKK